ncbi:MAG: ATP-binding cassette, subfamily bacterial, partial [Verrucomicrobiota bacterium]|nr:ATP-binding cassette, subfamily bacterial [Verrucomicrobiota bacterium]
NGVLQFIVNYWGHMLGINIETDMRRRLFDHIQKLSFRFFDNTKTGHLMSRMSTDLFDIGEMAHHGPEDVFIAVMTLLGAFVIMLLVHWKLALLTFIAVPILIWVAIVCNQRMTKAVRKMFSDIADYNARVEDTFGGIRVVQAFANEEHEKRLFAANNLNFRRSKLAGYKIMSWSLSISYFLMRLVTLFILLCGAWYVFHDHLTTGQFFGFLLLANVLFRPIEKINAVIELYPKGLAGFKRYSELIDTAPEVVDRPNAMVIDHLAGAINYENVSFSYESGREVLHGINLSIKEGETVAFVGPSGAGKTTLCSLLPRFYDVSGGRITIDGNDIRDLTLNSLRRQIGIVQQDVFLFGGTLRENIVYGNLVASESEIREAAQRAHLEEFVFQLDRGLDTLIGERGVKLSGGQKQRLAIARMFLKNPPILILDEATSALDSETEAIIQRSLGELSAGRTTLIIAHRLATTKNADRIIVVSENAIAEEGRHEELLALGGIFARLHQAQFGILPS